LKQRFVDFTKTLRMVSLEANDKIAREEEKARILAIKNILNNRQIMYQTIVDAAVID